MERGIVVFSGGTAANSLVDTFSDLASSQQCGLSYVMPISDNGGSSSEIIRTLGGPGIGDIRSRLVRLVSSTRRRSVAINPLYALLSHRLPSDPELANQEWHDLIECRHPLWVDVPSDKRELIRSFFNLTASEITKRARPSSSISFSFQDAALGNLFLTGARIFTGSLESAICLFKDITGIGKVGPSDASGDIEVLPVINTNHTMHIGVTLRDHTVIFGQNEISHPRATTAFNVEPVEPNNELIGAPHVPANVRRKYSLLLPGNDHPTMLPGSLPSLAEKNISFTKNATDEPRLSAKIDEIWYMNTYGQKIEPHANPRAIEAVTKAKCIIYSIGSLFTSIMPCIIARGMTDAIYEPNDRATGGKKRVLMINRSADRETMGAAHESPMNYYDIVRTIVRAFRTPEALAMNLPHDMFLPAITDIVYIAGRDNGSIPVRETDADDLEMWPDRESKERLENRNFEDQTMIQITPVQGRYDAKTGAMEYDPNALLKVLREIMDRVEGEWHPR